MYKLPEVITTNYTIYKWLSSHCSLNGDHVTVIKDRFIQNIQQLLFVTIFCLCYFCEQNGLKVIEHTAEASAI